MPGKPFYLRVILANPLCSPISLGGCSLKISQLATSPSFSSPVDGDFRYYLSRNMVWVFILLADSFGLVFCSNHSMDILARPACLPSRWASGAPFYFLRPDLFKFLLRFLWVPAPSFWVSWFRSSHFTVLCCSKFVSSCLSWSAQPSSPPPFFFSVLFFWLECTGLSVPHTPFRIKTVASQYP